MPQHSTVDTFIDKNKKKKKKSQINEVTGYSHPYLNKSLCIYIWNDVATDKLSSYNYDDEYIYIYIVLTV